MKSLGQKVQKGNDVKTSTQNFSFSQTGLSQHDIIKNQLKDKSPFQAVLQQRNQQFDNQKNAKYQNYFPVQGSDAEIKNRVQKNKSVGQESIRSQTSQQFRPKKNITKQSAKGCDCSLCKNYSQYAELNGYLNQQNKKKQHAQYNEVCENNKNSDLRRVGHMSFTKSKRLPSTSKERGARDNCRDTSQSRIKKNRDDLAQSNTLKNFQQQKIVIQSKIPTKKIDQTFKELRNTSVEKRKPQSKKLPQKDLKKSQIKKIEPEKQKYEAQYLQKMKQQMNQMLHSQTKSKKDSQLRKVQEQIQQNAIKQRALQLEQEANMLRIQELQLKKKIKKRFKKTKKATEQTIDPIIKQYQEEQNNHKKSLEDLTNVQKNNKKQKKSNSKKKPKVQSNEEILDLQNISLEDLKVMLQNQEFCDILNQQGYDVKQIMATIKQNDALKVQSPKTDQSQVVQQKQPQDINDEDRLNMEEILQNMDPYELRDKLKDIEFKQKLEVYSFDLDELIKQVNDEIQTLEKEQQNQEILQISSQKKSDKSPIKDESKNQEKQFVEYGKLDLENMSAQDLKQKLMEKHFKQFLEAQGYDVVDLEKQADEELRQNGGSDQNLMDLDLENMDPMELRERLQNDKFRKNLESLGVDVLELIQQVEQEINKGKDEDDLQFQDQQDTDDNQQLNENLEEVNKNEEFDLNELENMDPFELQRRLQNKQFCQILEKKGLNTKELIEELDKELKYIEPETEVEEEDFDLGELENMDPYELQKRLKDKNFVQLLENKGLNTKELIEELDNMQDVAAAPVNPLEDFDFNELENMDPLELREKLNDEQFVQMLEEKGLNIAELINELDSQLHLMEEEPQPSKAQKKTSNPIPQVKENQIVDLESLDINQLREQLKNEEFRNMLVEQGYDLQEIMDQVQGEDVLENIDPEQLKENLKNPEFRKMLEEQGYNVYELMQELGQGGQSERIDLENMDPQELKENLENEDFRNMLEQQGYDVKDIMKQVFQKEKDEMIKNLKQGSSAKKRKNSF